MTRGVDSRPKILYTLRSEEISAHPSFNHASNHSHSSPRHEGQGIKLARGLLSKAADAIVAIDGSVRGPGGKKTGAVDKTVVADTGRIFKTSDYFPNRPK